jgi:hypothetical protein
VSRQADRMLALLRGAGVPLPADAVIVRTYAGRNMLSAGAWSWRVERPNRVLPRVLVGSQWPLTELLRRAELVASEDVRGEISVDPGPPSARACYRQWVLVKPS